MHTALNKPLATQGANGIQCGLNDALPVHIVTGKRTMAMNKTFKENLATSYSHVLKAAQMVVVSMSVSRRRGMDFMVSQRVV